MPGAFDELLAGDYEGPRARAQLDPAWLARARTGVVTQPEMESGPGASSYGAYEGDYTGAGFLARGNAYGAEDGFNLAVGGRWVDQYDKDGKWVGRTLGNSAWTDWRDSVGKMALYSAGAYYGVKGLDGLVNGAAATTGGAGSQYGGAAAEILGADTAGYTAGMGAGTGAGATTTALGADALAVPNTTTAATANLGTIPTTTAAAGAAAPAGGLTTWQQVVSLGKDLGLDAKGIAGLLIAKGLAKDVPPSVADPNLVKAINDANAINEKAQARAESNDALWQKEFMPRYLDAMDRMRDDSARLSDFNMGLAQKYDKRYWDTTAKQQDKFYAMVDAYDSDANRDQLVGKAAATSDFNSQGAMDALGRNMRSMGVNPMSGKYASQIGRLGMDAALNKTLAMNTAREAARKEGLNMRAVAAGLGGNLSGASAGFAGQAAGASGLGMAGVQGAHNGLVANDQNWRANMGLAGNMAQMTGNWGWGTAQANNYATQLNVQGNNALLGYGLGLFSSGTRKG